MILDINEDDIANIKLAIQQGGKVWENPLIQGFKTKVKTYYRHYENEQCCYCRRDLEDEFNMVIDIEHILPKGEFKDYMFQLFNLNISCKRCNMLYKREKTDFVIDLNEVLKTPEDTTHYKMIHPNLDKYFNHIKLNKIVDDKYKLIKYQVLNGSPKGQFTYDYFNLKKIEIDTLNGAQGVKEKPELSETIDPKIANALKDIFKSI
ncbi:hypothetical protein [Fluviicola taffensis]|uniref:hypothetical protein n=1 Tax=Fluviicola taffensis TaxID=191579 RepID=UPI0031380653